MKHSYNNDKIIQMNKFIGNLYLFSKLTTTLVLFLIVLLMGYAFVKSYQSQNTNNFKLDEKLLSLIDTIDESQQNLEKKAPINPQPSQDTEEPENLENVSEEE